MDPAPDTLRGAAGTLSASSGINPKRFLISRLSALGDVTCTLPMAVALKRGFPDCVIDWVVDPRFAGVVECCDAVDNVIRAKPGFRWDTIPTYDQHYDAAIDAQGLTKSGLAILRAKANQKVGYHWQREASFLFSSRVMPDPSSFHVVDQYVDVARYLGGLMDRAEFCLVPKPEDLASVKAKLAGIDRFVVMNGGAGWVTKRWPPSHFAELIRRLGADGITAVLIGAKGDVLIADEIRSAGCEFHTLVGQTSVKELIALISLARAHVGGDTGSSHIAAALGIPAISFYSITRPKRCCPYGQIDRCHFHPDGLQNIDVEKIEHSVRAVL